MAGSLKMGAVGVPELIRGLQGGGRPSTLGRAIPDECVGYSQPLSRPRGAGAFGLALFQNSTVRTSRMPAAVLEASCTS